ncbi:MAG: hypothetical protein ACJ789_16955 [Thermomicrobiales bacterium]
MPTFAMKVYDLQWFTTFGMSYDEAAESLVADGIDTVLTQNQIDPLPNSGVDQRDYLASFGNRLTTYTDDAWVTTLRKHGLRVVQTSAVFFDPPSLERYSDACPIDADGRAQVPFDWYLGICPTHEAHLAEKIAKLRRVVAELQPSALFLQFFRYPGFWENWTWSPDYVFSNRDRFCFCDRCRSAFAHDLSIALPAGDFATQVTHILSNHAEAWTDWRCRRIADVAARIRSTVIPEQPQMSIMLNTLPFPASDFNRQNARREYAAQDLSLLAPYIERFELMTYLQILNRPISWITPAVLDAKLSLPEGREVVCTLQVDALYTDGVHRDRQRAPEVDAAEIEAAAFKALDAGADGLVFYHWTDFLQDVSGSKRAALRRITGV